MQRYEEISAISDRQQFVGEIFADDRGKVMVDVKNRFQLGDELELMMPSGNRVFALESMLDRNGTSINVAPGSGHIVEIPELPGAATDFGLLLRTIRPH